MSQRHVADPGALEWANDIKVLESHRNPCAS